MNKKVKVHLLEEQDLDELIRQAEDQANEQQSEQFRRRKDEVEEIANIKKRQKEYRKQHPGKELEFSSDTPTGKQINEAIQNSNAFMENVNAEWNKQPTPEKKSTKVKFAEYVEVRETPTEYAKKDVYQKMNLSRNQEKPTHEPSYHEAIALKQKAKIAMKKAEMHPTKSVLAKGKFAKIKEAVIRQANMTRYQLQQLKPAIKERIPFGQNNVKTASRSIALLTDLFTRYNGKWDRIKIAMNNPKEEHIKTWSVDVKNLENYANTIKAEYEKLAEIMDKPGLSTSIEMRFDKLQQLFARDYQNIENNLAEIRNSAWYKTDSLITELTTLFNHYYEKKAELKDILADLHPVKDIAVAIKEKYQNLEALTEKKDFPSDIQARLDKFKKLHEFTYKALDKDIPKENIEDTSHTTFRPMR